MVFVREIMKIPLKAFPGVGKARRGGQPGTGSNDYRIRVMQCGLQPDQLIRVSFGRFVRQAP